MESRDTFSLAVDRAGQMVSCRQLSHGLPTAVFKVEPREVAGVEILHSARSSRSSEIVTVLSLPRRSLPLTANRSNPADNFLLAKNGFSLLSLCGRSFATVRPRSVTQISPNSAVRRTQCPVFACKSRIVITFMCHTVSHAGDRVKRTRCQLERKTSRSTL